MSAVDAPQMVVLVFDEIMWVEIEELLEGAGVSGYTRLPGLHGSGRRGGPRHDTAIWPGTSSAVLAVVDAPLRQRLLAGVRGLRGSRETAAVHAYVVPVLEVV